MNNRVRAWLSDLLDYLWPRLTGEPEKQPSNELFCGAIDANLLSETASNLSKRALDTENRHRSVDTKLLGLLALTSVFSAAVTAVFAVASGGWALERQPFSFQSGYLILIGFIAFQLIRALWATIAGLVRRSFKSFAVLGLAPRDGEKLRQYRIRVLNDEANNIRWNDWVVNRKVEQLAIAHAAVKNALRATGLLIVLGLASYVCNMV